MNYPDVLRTPIQRGSPAHIVQKREKLISEAISWEGGTIENPQKKVVRVIDGYGEFYFLKPGKESVREKNPNIHDMTPKMGNVSENWQFADIWSILTRIAFIDFSVFKALMVLIYRNGYLLDHDEGEDGVIRYAPKDDVWEAIIDIDKKIKEHCSVGAVEILHFLDLLGWNEDVKYHSENGNPSNVKEKFNVGRINTCLSCIRAPYQMYLVIENVIENANKKMEINYNNAFDTMQSLSRSGTCAPTQTSLREWFPEYLF